MARVVRELETARELNCCYGLAYQWSLNAHRHNKIWHPHQFLCHPRANCINMCQQYHRGRLWSNLIPSISAALDIQATTVNNTIYLSKVWLGLAVITFVCWRHFWALSFKIQVILIFTTVDQLLFAFPHRCCFNLMETLHLRQMPADTPNASTSELGRLGFITLLYD